MTDDQLKPVTPLDEALVAAQEDGSQANFYYDSFLNTDLYFPVQVLGAQEGSWRRLGMTEKFQPLFLAFPQGKAVPTFDKLERMKEWAAEKGLDYAVLKGYQLLGIVADDVGIMINLATPFHYTLTPDTLNLLRSAMRPVQPT